MKITKEKYEHFHNMQLEKYPFIQATKDIAEEVEEVLPSLKEFCIQMNELALSIDEARVSMERSNRRKLLGKER